MFSGFLGHLERPPPLIVRMTEGLLYTQTHIFNDNVTNLMFRPLDWMLRYTVHRTLIAFQTGEFVRYVPM